MRELHNIFAGRVLANNTADAEHSLMILSKVFAST